MTARPQDVAMLPPLDPLPEGYKPREWECTHQAATYFYQEGHAAALASAQAREDELRAEVERWRGHYDDMSRRAVEAVDRREDAEARAERLAEALRAAWLDMEQGIDQRIVIAAIRAALSTNAETQTGETNEAAE